MDDREILDLVKAAVDVDELRAAEEGRAPLGTYQAPRRLKGPAWVLAGMGLAAVVALWFSRAAEYAPLQDVRIAYVGERSGTTGWQLDLGVKHPAHVGVVVVDERGERWLVPFDSGELWKKVDRQERVLLPRHPAPTDKRGPAVARYVMVIASPSPAPAADELLNLIPEPIVAPTMDDGGALLRLREIAVELQDELGVEVRLLTCP